MVLPLHLLRQFASVADLRGFTRAADALRISQPAVSKGVRELEEQVGTPLVDRDRGGLKLTPAGELLAGYAREIFAIERTAEQELRAIRALDGGSLTVGASTTIANYHLPPLLAAFHAAHPNVALQLISANTEAIVEMLIHRDLNIALVEGSVSNPRIESVLWRREEMVLIAAPRHRLVKKGKPVTAADIENELLVAREGGSGTRAEADRILRAIGAQPVRFMEIGSTEAIKQIVAASTGISVIAQSAIADLVKLGRLAVLQTVAGPFERPLWQLRLKGARESRAGAAFQTYLAPRHTP